GRATSGRTPTAPSGSSRWRTTSRCTRVEWARPAETPPSWVGDHGRPRSPQGEEVAAVVLVSCGGRRVGRRWPQPRHRVPAQVEGDGFVVAVPEAEKAGAVELTHDLGLKTSVQEGPGERP